jgi:CRP-like cAMP-binding protein
VVRDLEPAVDHNGPSGRSAASPIGKESAVERRTSVSIPILNMPLRALSSVELKRLLPFMRQRSFESKQVLARAGSLIVDVFFPLSGLVSLITTMRDGSTAETGVVGNEGLIGVEVFLGQLSTGNMMAVQEVPGEALVMDARTFARETASGGTLRQVVQGYAWFLMAQTMQTAACNRLHSVDRRLGRTLLMISARTGVASLPLTHEYLSELLGVARPSVSIAAGTMRRAGLIRYHRGSIVITDRAALEEASCECFAAMQEEYRRLMPVFDERRSQGSDGAGA